MAAVGEVGVVVEEEEGSCSVVKEVGGRTWTRYGLLDTWRPS